MSLNISLLSSESLHRIYETRAARGNESGDGSRRGQEKRSSDVAGEIVRVDAEKRRTQNAREEKSAADASENSENDGPHSLAKHKAQHRGAIRAERHAHADLARPLRNAVRDRAIQSRRGQRESDNGEKSEEPSAQALLPDRICHFVIERNKIENAHFRRNRRHFLAEQRHDAERIDSFAHPHQKMHLLPGELQTRVVEIRPSLAAERLMAHIADYANHRHPIRA